MRIAKFKSPPVSKLLVPLALFLGGCSGAVQLANEAQKAADEQTANTGSKSAAASDTSSGGSLALSEPEASDANASKIHILVLNEAACEQEKPGKPRPRDERGHRPGPRAQFHGDRRGPRRPMHDPRFEGRFGPQKLEQGNLPELPPFQGEFGQQKGVEGNLPELPPEENSGGEPILNEAGASMAKNQPPNPIAQNQCVVKDVSEAFNAGKDLKIDGIPDGDYLVVVRLEDESDKRLEEGSGKVTITTGQVATADIMLAPVKEGSLTIKIHEAASKLAIVSAALSEKVDVCGALTIETEDPNGVAAPVANALSLLLASNSATGAFFSDNTCTTSVTSVNLAAQGSQVTVYYKDSAVGTPVLSVSGQAASGLDAASVTSTISAL